VSDRLLIAGRLGLCRPESPRRTRSGSKKLRSPLFLACIRYSVFRDRTVAASLLPRLRCRRGGRPFTSGRFPRQEVSSTSRPRCSPRLRFRRGGAALYSGTVSPVKRPVSAASRPPPNFPDGPSPANRAVEVSGLLRVSPPPVKLSAPDFFDPPRDLAIPRTWPAPPDRSRRPPPPPTTSSRPRRRRRNDARGPPAPHRAGPPPPRPAGTPAPQERRNPRRRSAGGSGDTGRTFAYRLNFFIRSPSRARLASWPWRRR
jgi:hypothetical protein